MRRETTPMATKKKRTKRGGRKTPRKTTGGGGYAIDVVAAVDVDDSKAINISTTKEK